MRMDKTNFKNLGKKKEVIALTHFFQFFFRIVNSKQIYLIVKNN